MDSEHQKSSLFSMPEDSGTVQLSEWFLLGWPGARELETALILLTGYFFDCDCF